MSTTYQTMIDTLAAMHSYRRPHGSPSDLAFCDRFISGIPGAVRDVNGNWIVTRGPVDTPVLFSSHTDTVHRVDGYQNVQYDDQYVLSLTKDAKRVSNCLGADDTAGVFLMREMLDRGIAGTYIFHFGEEKGGIGSRALASSRPDWLRRFHMAIAFDRQGYSDVITHQGYRTASDAFARGLAGQLNQLRGLTYAASSHGIYTDTAEYSGLIPECTNLSVGYFGAHSDREKLDCLHVLTLLEAISAADFSAVPVERNPDAMDDDQYVRGLFSHDWHSRWTWEDDLPQYGTTPRVIDTSSMSDRQYWEWIHGIDEDQPDSITDAPVSDRASLYLDADFEAVQDSLRRVQRELNASINRRYR